MSKIKLSKKYIYRICKDALKEDYIDFSFIEITQKNLIGVEEFNELFFQKIDEIENKISNGDKLESLIDDLEIIPIKKNV